MAHYLVILERPRVYRHNIKLEADSEQQATEQAIFLATHYATGDADEVYEEDLFVADVVELYEPTREPVGL